MSLQILAFDEPGPQGLWEEALAAVRPGLRDVYFTSAYNLLWQERGDGRALGAVFREGRSVILYPFLLRDLEKDEHLGSEWAGYHDLTSAPGFSGPLVVRMTGDDQLLGAFRAAFGDWCRDQRVVSEFSRFHPLLDSQLGWETHMEVDHVGSIVWGRLERGRSVSAGAMSATARRNVRLALEAGLTGGVERGSEAYERFAQLLAEEAVARGGRPQDAADAAFLDRLRRKLGPAQTLVGVRHEGELVAAALFVGGPSFVHLFAAAADPRRRQMRPHNLLMFCALQWAAGSGASALNLGGGRAGEDELLRFKGGFSPLRAARHVGRVIHLFEEYARALRDHDAVGISLDCDYFPGYRAPLPQEASPPAGSRPGAATGQRE